MDEWLKIIGERLREAQVPLPVDDWEMFEANMKAKKRHSSFVRWVAAAASLVAAAAVTAFFLPKKSVEEVIEKMVSPVSPIPERLAQASDTPVTPPPVILSPSGEESSSAPVILSPQGEESTSPAPVILSPQDEESVPQTSNNAISDNDFQDYETSRETHSRRRLSVAPHLGGMRSDVAAQVSFPSFPGKNFYASNHGKQGLVPYSNSLNNGLSSLSADHSIPITFGVDLSFPINQRLAITSGVEMSSYKSVFTEIIYKQSLTQNRYLTQKALYLGIPLRIDWSFWQGGKFSAWIGAGGKVDRCVYARLDGEDIRDKDFNFSALADAGIRYDFLEYLGIYLAPEVSWYFKPDNPSILTYRTEHPFALTINVGLRLNL